MAAFQVEATTVDTIHMHYPPKYCDDATVEVVRHSPALDTNADYEEEQNRNAMRSNIVQLTRPGTRILRIRRQESESLWDNNH